MNSTVRLTDLIVDSNSRDTAVYPEPSNFSITLPESFKDVQELTLKSTWFPFSAFQINIYNSVIDVVFNGIPIAISIPPGNYTPSTLASMVQIVLQEVDPGFSVSTSSMDVFTFSHTSQAFALGFGSPMSASKALGFGSGSYPSGSLNTIEAPFGSDLDDYNRYVVIHIDGFNNAVIPNNAVNKAFGVLYRHKMLAGLDQHIVSICNPIIGKLAKLNISILDKYGNLYNCQNQNFVLGFGVAHDSVRQNW